MEQIRVSTFAGPGALPVIHTVPRPKISSKAALIKIGACGVCGTDLHILKGHWPKQLPWPFTLGHELGLRGPRTSCRRVRRTWRHANVDDRPDAKGERIGRRVCWRAKKFVHSITSR